MQKTSRIAAEDFRYLRLKRNAWIGPVLFMLLLVSSSCAVVQPKAGSDAGVSMHSRHAVFDIMRKVADWQLDRIADKGWRHPERNWTNGALYTGLVAYAKLAQDSACFNFMRNIGEKFNWQIVSGKARYFADNYCVGQMYCAMYARFHEERMIADLRMLADTLAARPHTESLKWQNNIHLREWAWCDALFMGPPSLAMLSKVTGEKKYMDLVDLLWWKTTDYLYDPQAALFYRDSRYFDKRESNGKKVFWSRGNGWVMGGLVRVLENMPEYYKDRKRWLKLYQDMAAKIAALQQPDGTWHASLLDPEHYPLKETSGSGFFCYALAWGINHGLLNKDRFTPMVWKAWDALVDCVHPNGMLGYAQQVGADPQKVNADDTEVYAVGAFLLAGSEMIKMAEENRR